MKRSRLPIALMSGLIAVIAIVAFTLFTGSGTRAQDSEPLLQYPDFPPTPTIAPAPAAPAIAGEKATGAVLFADSFDGQKSGAWEFADLNDVLPEERTAWSVQDGRLQQDGTVIPFTPKTHETAAFVGDPAWSDYTVSAKVYDQINGTFGLIARRTGNSYYRYRAYADFFDVTPKQVLEKVVDGVATPLVTLDGPGFKQRQWYTVTMSVKGSEISVWLDGQLVAQATDSTLTSGQAGLYTRSIGNIFFDDVQISQQ